MESIGNVFIDKPFVSDDFEIKMEGIGKFRADSLVIGSLRVDSEGMGSVLLAGKAGKANFSLEGTGEIDAMELLTDSVYAEVDGIGSVKCNPVEFLKGTISGIGKITYKEEPKEKNISTVGIGKVSKR
jgi:hypothetical protein